MDDVARGRGLLLTTRGLLGPVAAAASLLAIGCAKDALNDVGTSRPRSPGTALAATKAPDAMAPAAVLPADYRKVFARITPEPVPTRGHVFGRFMVTAYANELGKAALGGKVPADEGAIVIVEHEESSGGEIFRGPTMLMQKLKKDAAPTTGDWKFVVVTHDGKLAHEGALTSCARCHADAPSDYLFGFPPTR
jgi:hypothetical protein